MTPQAPAAAPLAAFFGLASALSWLAWAPLVAHAFGATAAAPPQGLHLLGGLGPAAAALLVARWEGRLGPLLRGAFRLDRATLPWIAGAVLAPVAIHAIAAVVLTALGYPYLWHAVGRSAEFPTLTFGQYALASFVCYGLGEELGWRGFALPRLQLRRSERVAALWVAAGWAGWHLPLFAFAEGMKAMGPAGAVGWLASIAAGSFLMTFVYNRSRGSVLAVAGFHAALDVLIGSPMAGPLQAVMGAVVTVAGFGVLLLLRPRAPAPQ